MVMIKDEIDTNQDPGLLESLLRDATEAPEPMSVKEIIHKGDEALPAPMVAQVLDSAGFVYIWETRTGERSIVHRNNLKDDLLKKREDGSFVFTTRDPHIKPYRGTLKCLLHPSNPNCTHYAELGLPTCRKSNLTSPLQVELHMRHRHKIEWETIERERIQAEKEEEKAFQRALLSRATPEVVSSLGEVPEVKKRRKRSK